MTLFVIVKNPDEYGRGPFVRSNLRGFSYLCVAFRNCAKGLLLAREARDRIQTAHPEDHFEVRLYNYGERRFEVMPRNLVEYRPCVTEEETP